ncbi:bifunctional acetaldehyde-CoA/alcohol dehydrogenase [Paludicola sp. MB14-C6]|uniref:bifunctional acetaldehyde-CoA/alcohol dehydrogenase n=1 Tax=Paludihabitans sp. MB14-C6 TaxID=3070656 RepID=UPI0027DBAFCE|nr:bifunctional acetaldehyde-CoA/alcohol dehydrogenase [Paludicola sp. MB14-C6]WMJ23336.1 bifunctional acetaldehyde-CoA/alcohol dehydrogenase [Paludicola sp. MB14-C6]
MANKEKKDVAVVETDVTTAVDSLVKNGMKALEEFMSFDQERIDKIVHAMAIAGLDNHMKLSKMAVEETGRGVFEDKVIKNIYATEYIWHNIKHDKTVGIINDDETEGLVEIAEPVGVIAGVTPVTNPTSTTLFKSIISIKARNPIIFGFHPSAQKCSSEAARIVRDAAIAAGAPENCIQWIETPSIEATNALMNHPNIALVLATGGSGMVKAAYSTGKPALGVGPGNVPCYINKNVNVERACNDLMLSKTFDNGMICASEQAVIVDKDIQDTFEKYMKANNCYFLNEQETKIVSDYVIVKDKGAVNAAVVGKPAAWIAEQAGVKVPAGTKILIGKIKDVGPDYPLSREKLSPVLAYIVVKDAQEGIKMAKKMLNMGGLGHTAVVHSDDQEVISAYGNAMKVGRLIANSPSSQGGIGDIYNENTPSLTLGCGSFGKNSTTSNVSAMNLLNIKRIAKRRVNMQWFKIPPKIYFEYNAIQYLEKMPNISRAFIVTDPMMVKLGYMDKVLRYLRKRQDYCHAEIFSEVEPDPSVETIMRGVDAMNNFKPDVIIALGGGSAMDAAKGMWLFYEHPDTSFDGLRQKFLDIRKRTFAFPKLGHKAQMVCVPTTSGTGSEVTSFSVITDKGENIKYPLADYELTPDVAIIDPQFVMTMPKSITADTGMDVLTHAIEAYVSIMASDYTDGLSLQAIKLVFEYLEKSYNGDQVAREKMHNASCIAGMAFTNAFLGLNHSMAHKLGGEYHIPHGRANAVLLPYVIKFNANKPTKFATFPKYEKFTADVRYAEIAKSLGLPAATVEEGVASLVKAIKELAKKLGVPMSIKDCGVDEKVFLDNLTGLSERAFEDQCTTANPRYPLVVEIAEIYKEAYYGK